MKAFQILDNHGKIHEKILAFQWNLSKTKYFWGQFVLNRNVLLRLKICKLYQLGNFNLIFGLPLILLYFKFGFR